MSAIPEKLCIFCVHFHWSKETLAGMGSTQTGPWFDGGDVTCDKGHLKNCHEAGKEPFCSAPDDEEDYRRIILRGESCPDYAQVVLRRR